MAQWSTGLFGCCSGENACSETTLKGCFIPCWLAGENEVTLRQETAVQMLPKGATLEQKKIARAVSGGGFWLQFVSYWAMINCCGADCLITRDQRNRVMALKGINDGSGWCGNFCTSCCCSPCAQCQHARELNPQDTQRLVGSAFGGPATGGDAPPGGLAPPVVAQPLLMF